MLTTSSANNSIARKFRLAAIIPMCLLMLACGQSPSPTVSDLVSIAPPSFSNTSSRFLTTPSKVTILRGTCDPVSYGIEYSIDGSDWTTLSSGCAQDGTFAITVTVEKTLKILARAKTKYSVTSSAEANVRYLLPPTSSSLSFVVASNSGDQPNSRMDFAMAHSLDGASSGNGSVFIDTHLPGIVHGKLQ